MLLLFHVAELLRHLLQLRHPRFSYWMRNVLRFQFIEEILSHRIKLKPSTNATRQFWIIYFYTHMLTMPLTWLFWPEQIRVYIKRCSCCYLGFKTNLRTAIYVATQRISRWSVLPKTVVQAPPPQGESGRKPRRNPRRCGNSLINQSIN